MASAVKGTGTITFTKVGPQDSAAPITHYFTKHMEEKAKTGFGARDVWQARYVDYHNSDGLAKALRFLGGMIGKVVLMASGTGKNINDLQAETAFYKSIVKAQVAYNKFADKPTENYQAVKEAFEALHQFHQRTLFKGDILKNSAEYHQLINDVLNKVAGKDVAKNLLEYFVTTELTKDGKFSQNNLLTFYTKYAATVAEKERAGYGTSGIDKYGQFPSAKDVEKSTIRMIFAHALKNELGKDEEARYAVFNQTVAMLKAPVSEAGSEVNAVINSLNEQLLNVMKKGQVDPDPALLWYISVDEQKGMIDLYSYMQKKSDIETNLERTRKAYSEAGGILEGLKSASTLCTYTTLSKIWSEQEAPMEFREYLTLKGEVDDLRKQIVDLSKEKEAVRVKAFDTHLEELKELTSQIDKVRNAIAEAQIEEKKSRLQCGQAYANAVTAKEKLGTPIDFTKASIDTIENDINFAGIENLNQCQKAYKTALQAQEAAGQKVADETAELNRLQLIREGKRKDIQSSIESDQAKIDNLIQERQQKIDEISAKTISLTGAQIVRANDLGVLTSFPELKQIAEKVEAQEADNFGKGVSFRRAVDQKKYFEKNEKSSAALTQLAGQGYDKDTHTLKYPIFERFRDKITTEIEIEKTAIKVKRSVTASLLNADLRHTVSQKKKAILNALNEEVKAYSNTIDNDSDDKLPALVEE